MINQSWHEFVARLSQAEVRFAIIGGHAVNFHGYLRTTEDLALVFLRDRATDETLLSSLREFGAFWIGDEIEPTTGLELTYPVTLEYIRNHSLLMLGTTFG